MIQGNVVQRNLVLPGISQDMGGNYVAPLSAVGGGFNILAATANQVLTTTLAGATAYMTDLIIIPTAVAALANTLQILDASGGTVLWQLSFGGIVIPVGTLIPIKFSVPLKASTPGGAFYVTTTGAAVTWSAIVHGYFDKGLGN